MILQLHLSQVFDAISISTFFEFSSSLLLEYGRIVSVFQSIIYAIFIIRLIILYTALFSYVYRYGKFDAKFFNFFARLSILFHFRSKSFVHQ